MIRNGTVRDALLTSDELAFVAPFYLQSEIAAHVPKIASRAQIPIETVDVIIEDVVSVIELLPSGTYSPWMARAGELVRRAHAEGDEDYVALCLAIDAPIWTLDKDFRRITGLDVFSTHDVETFGQRKRR